MEKTTETSTLEQPKGRLSYKRITTSIPSDKYLEIKQLGFSFSDLVLAGLQHRKGMPLMLERINKLEKANVILQQRVLILSDEIFRKKAKKE